jgi:beta-lactamase regulating signal transducer with metallopeptidase domain/tetratricopeptide (TPR) repeat protein
MSILGSGILFALGLFVRATAILAATALALLVVRRSSAATRHRVGTIGLGAALALPVLSLVLPRVSIPLAVPLASWSWTASAPRLPWLALAFGFWAAGSLVVAARLIVGGLRVRRLASEAAPVLDAGWIADQAAAARRLDLSRPVDVKESEKISVAITSGWRRPFLLVGRAARLWAADRRQVVLLHELAHVKRGDWPALLVAELAVALYWFHPLAMWLARRVRRDAEKACDELVISSGTKPSVYAAHLLGIFRSLGSAAQPVAPALSIARPHHFEERLRAILDPRAPVGRPGAWVSRFAAVGLVAAAAVVTAVEPRTTPAQLPAAITVASSSQCAKPPCPSASGKVVPVAAAEAPEPDEERADAVEPGSGRSLPAIWTVRSDSTRRTVFGFVKASNTRRTPRDGSHWYDQGMRFHHREKYAEAIAAFEKAIEDGYNEAASAYNIACGYALMGDSNKAFEWLKRSMDEGFDLAAYMGHDDDLDNLRTDPRWAEFKKLAREQKADEHKGEARSAAARYERLVARAPKSGEPFFEIGRELLNVDQYDLSANAFQASADRGYRVSTSLYNEACAMSRAGKKDQALDLLRRCLDAGFDQPDLFDSDDDLDNVRKDPRFSALADEAAELSLPSFGFGPWSSRSRSTRARWREAARGFASYAEKHPAQGRAWSNLGYASLSGDRPDEAAPAFQKALELGYRKPATMYNLACAYARLDQKDAAFEWLFKALDAGFDEMWTLRHDDDLDNLRADGRYRKAVEIARAKDKGESSD